eukprot:gene19840-24309_t
MGSGAASFKQWAPAAGGPFSFAAFINGLSVPSCQTAPWHGSLPAGAGFPRRPMNHREASLFPRILAIAATTVALTAGSVLAQDFNRRPSFGTLNLNFNFAPDPTIVNVTAGGNIPAERIGGPGCVGSIATPPDVRLNYRAGGGLPLYISATARTD